MKRALLISILFNLLLLATGYWAMLKLGGWNYLRYKMKNHGLAAVYGHRVDLFEHLELPDSCIVFIGNSLTEHGEWNELFNQPVYNRGIAGDGIEGLLNRLETITRAHPRQIFLMIGINDLISHSPEYVLQNYRKLLRQLQQATPRTKVHVQSLLPVNNQVRITGFQSEQIRQINQQLEKLAATFEYEFIDLYSVFADEKGDLDARFTADGVHLNGAGYLLWAKEVTPYVEGNRSTGYKDQ